jgi:hypothetical protein
VNGPIRWRMVSLQAILVLILASASGFAFYEGSFVTSMIHDQLVAQQIYFPGTDQIKSGGALDPKEFPAELRSYAGQQVDNGDKARVYANDFIAKHLQGVAGGQTYAQVSAQAQTASAALAADPTNPALQAQNAKVQGQVATLFKGETLISMLLNAYGWYTFGTYATYGGIGLMLAAVVVLGALVFELFVAGRRPETLKLAQKLAA